MTRLAGELEGAGASGYLTRVPGLLDRLERDFGRVRTALELEQYVIVENSGTTFMKGTTL
jgi:hypothetical protein